MTSAGSTSQASTPRWMWIALGGLALVVVGVLAFAGYALISSPEPSGSVESEPPAQSPVETTYMAIITNQGGLIADQQTMVKLGRDACQVVSFQAPNGTAEQNQSMAAYMFTNSHPTVSMQEANVIMMAASGSGLCPPS